VGTPASGLTPNPRWALPPEGSYGSFDTVARRESVPLAETIRLVLKTSHNLHASLLPAVVAAGAGERTPAVGLAILGRSLAALGVPVETITLGDGAGADAANAVTPRATVALLRAMARRADFASFRAALPVLGVDGTLASTAPAESPARGRVRAKTGTLHYESPLNGRSSLTSKALAGYADTLSGRRLAFAVFLNHAVVPAGSEAADAGRALVRVAEILCEGG